MLSKELRINNFVHCDWQKKFIKVTPFLIVEQFQSEIAKRQYLQRININESWLYSFGFKRSNNQFYIVYNEFGNIFAINIVKGYFEFTYGAIEIKYVHQLQNLFFDLFDKHLEFIE